MDKDKTGQEVEATLSSINGMNRASAPPHFYTRLVARMERGEGSFTDRVLQVLNRPAISISLFTLFLVLNVVAIKGIMPPAKAPSTATDSVQNFAAEYNLGAGQDNPY